MVNLKLMLHLQDSGARLLSLSFVYFVITHEL